MTQPIEQTESSEYVHQTEPNNFDLFKIFITFTTTINQKIDQTLNAIDSYEVEIQKYCFKAKIQLKK